MAEVKSEHKFLKIVHKNKLESKSDKPFLSKVPTQLDKIRQTYLRVNKQHNKMLQSKENLTCTQTTKSLRRKSSPRKSVKLDSNKFKL
jgi:hypothetical protein